MNHAIALQPLDWLNLFFYYISISLLAVGGAIATAPDMHRFLVERQGWLTDLQFNASIAIAQAAPGPNVLFIALLGWNVGLQSGGWPHAALGLSLALAGILLPSSLLTLVLTRWAHRHRDDRAVRAFKQGMAPVVVGLLLATAWIVATAQTGPRGLAPLVLVAAGVTLLVWRTRVHLLWLLGAGALLGAFGIV